MPFLDFFARYTRKRNPLVHDFLMILKCLPLSYRKEVITFCQVGTIPYNSICSLARTKPVTVVTPYDRYPVVVDEYLLEKYLLPYSESMSFRSIIWMFCRTIPEPAGDDESLQVYEDTFFKEFHASQNIFSWFPRFDHSILLLDYEHPIPPPWAGFARRVATSFIARIKRLDIIFPKVQRTKNTSRETGYLLHLADPGFKVEDVRTVDLEVHYARTGMKIEGACELRSAWKFNDLKPRFYYCCGGREYWKSRYMKRIAVILMESIPPTRANRRTRPENFLRSSLEDFIVLYDFYSFTTNLSELKYFIYYLARCIEGEVYTVRVLDYHLGVLELSLSEMLLEYNDSVNIQSPFSIFRIIDRFAFGELDGSVEYSQQNSGMLGVAGNIGFSTALHGFVLGCQVGEDKAVDIGDDAMAITPEDPWTTVIEPMSRLGVIHPDKTKIIPPFDGGPEKFLKRALYRLEDGSLIFDRLLNICISVYVDGEVGSRTGPTDMSWFARMKRVGYSTASVLWAIYSYGESFEAEDLLILEDFLRSMYRYCCIEERGWLPGYSFSDKSTGDKIRSTFVMPSIRFNDYDPRLVDFMEYMMENSNQSQFDLPIYSPEFRVPMLVPGEEKLVPQQKIFSVLQDLGYVKTRAAVETVTLLSAESKWRLSRRLKRVTSSEVRCQYVHCLEYIPERFETFFSDTASNSVGYYEIADMI